MVCFNNKNNNKIVNHSSQLDRWMFKKFLFLSKLFHLRFFIRVVFWFRWVFFHFLSKYLSTDLLLLRYCEKTLDITYNCVCLQIIYIWHRFLCICITNHSAKIFFFYNFYLNLSLVISRVTGLFQQKEHRHDIVNELIPDFFKTIFYEKISLNLVENKQKSWRDIWNCLEIYKIK